MEMRINPGIALVEPDSEISVLAPARGRGRDRLLRRMVGQKCRRRGELKIPLAIGVFARQPKILMSVSRLANERFQKLRPFKPPMAEQLRVERARRQSDRNPSARSSFICCRRTSRKWAACASAALSGPGRIVEFLLAIAAGDPVIFQAGKLASGAGGALPAEDIREEDRSRCRDKNRGRPDRPDNLPSRSRPAGSNRGRAQTRPGRPACKAGRVDSRGAAAARRTSGHAHRE